MKRWRGSREKLSGGDGRSIERVAGVIEDAHAKPAMDALVEFALDDPDLRSKVVPILEEPI